MNFRHLSSVPGILEVAGVITCLLAASLGSASYYLSRYNKSCRDGSAEDLLLPTVPGDNLSTLDGSTTLRTRNPSPPTPTVLSPLRFSQINQETTNDPSTTSSTDEYKDMAPVLWMERFQMSTTWMAVIISATLLVLYITFDKCEDSKIYKTVNFGFHFLFMVLLICSAIFTAYAAIEIDRQICQHHFDKREECQKYIQNMCAAAFTLLTAVLYAAICVKIIASKLYEKV